MSNRLVHRVVIGPVPTVGAVNAVLATFAPANYVPVVNNCVLLCKGKLLGKIAAGNGVGLEVSAMIVVVAGGVSLDGASVPTPAIGNAALTAATGFFDVSVGTTLRLQATGVAAQTINWTGYLDIWTTDF